MNPSSAILGSVVVITTTTVIRRVREKAWESHLVETFIFGFLLLATLLILAIPFPGFAKALAMLGMVGAFIVNGPAVFGLLGELGK